MSSFLTSSIILFMAKKIDKVVALTGGSSGIGYEIAKLLGQKGYKVYAGARRVEKMEPLKEYGVVPVYLDVTDEESASSFIKQILEKEGRIDALINNAGYGAFGPLETTPIEEAKKEFEVNVYGYVRMIQLVLPHMRERKKGTILNLSSAGGKVTTNLGGWYHASKYAIESLSDALRMETKPFGIKVTMVEPAGIYSHWGSINADNLEKAGKGTVYQSETDKVAYGYRKMFSKISLFVDDPHKVAKKAEKAIRKKNPKACYRAGNGSFSLPFLHFILPTKAFDALMVKIMHVAGKGYKED